MAENTKIEWATHTFNPWIGCTKVSEGCQFCYAEALMDKRYGKVKWGPQGVRMRTSEANWKKPLAWNRKAEKEGKRHRVFCASLADVFEEKSDQPEMDEWRTDLFRLIDKTPNLDWLLLTKRPENVEPLYHGYKYGYGFDADWDDFPKNIWIGTSVENQEQADLRIPELLRIPAAVRFLSMEPLLGPVDIGDASGVTYWDDPSAGLHWIICGGESGTNARPMHPDWVRSLRDQCVNAGVPFFFKQWGEWVDFNQVNAHALTADDNYAKYTVKGGALDGKRFVADHGVWDCALIKAGKKSAGRLLDGRTWDEFPTTETTP